MTLQDDYGMWARFFARPMGKSWYDFLASLMVGVPGGPTSGPYTPGDNSEVVLCDATSGAFSVVMPTAVGKLGIIYRIKKTDSSANAVTVECDGAETIDGDATFDLEFQDEVITIVSDDTNWWII